MEQFFRVVLSTGGWHASIEIFHIDEEWGCSSQFTRDLFSLHKMVFTRRSMQPDAGLPPSGEEKPMEYQKWRGNADPFFYRSLERSPLMSLLRQLKSFRSLVGSNAEPIVIRDSIE